MRTPTIRSFKHLQRFTLFNQVLAAMFLLDDKERYQVGHYSIENYSICMYGVPNNALAFREIKNALNAITPKYRFIVNKKDKDEPFINVNILDIGL